MSYLDTHILCAYTLRTRLHTCAQFSQDCSAVRIHESETSFDLDLFRTVHSPSRTIIYFLLQWNKLFPFPISLLLYEFRVKFSVKKNLG